MFQYPYIIQVQSMQQGLFYKQHHGYSMQHDTHFALKRDFCGLQTPSPGTLQLPAML